MIIMGCHKGIMGISPPGGKEPSGRGLREGPSAPQNIIKSIFLYDTI